MHRIVAVAVIGLLCAATAESASQAMPLARLDRPVWTSAQSFTSISGLRELPDGRLFVSDVDERQLYLIDRTGQRATPLGRVGEGPGEYGAPTVLLPMPGDSTLLLDRDALRYLIIDPAGRVTATTPFPPELLAAAPFLQGADRQGQLYFQARALADRPGGAVPVIRWDRHTGRIDSVASVHLPAPRPVTLRRGVIVRQIMPYTPSDAWGVAPSGRVLIVRTDPYRVEWVVPGGSSGRGEPISVPQVPVTDADKRAHEPNAPPFRREYPQSKPPFASGHPVTDPDGKVIVMRSRAAGAQTSYWDVFDQSGKLLGTQEIPSDLRIVAVTRRLVYVARTDADDLRWLEAYAR